ncbi:MAG: hypothetical protein WBF83_10845 [Moheibacter sp.]
MKEFFAAERKIFPSIFRVLIGLILLFDLVYMYRSASIFLNPELNSFLPTDKISAIVAQNSGLFFLFYGLILILFILGLLRNLMSFLVFCCYLILFHLSYQFVTWGDIILKFTMLFFVFADSFRFLSLNRTKGDYPFISVLAVWSIILHIFMVYLNNAYFKLTDHHWQQGIAVYYSFAQYAQFSDSIFHWPVSNPFFSKSIDYFIILQQLLFVPFVIWKRTRYLMLILAAIIHLTMMVQFGLWKFELAIVLHYGFLLNDEELRRLMPIKFRLKYFSAD